MIRSFYGLTQNPFDARELELLPQQQVIHDTLKVHCQQGGLCLVLGVPGTGKSVLKQSLQRLPENQHLVATVGRTLHTYTNTVKILCDAFRIEFASPIDRSPTPFVATFVAQIRQQLQPRPHHRSAPHRQPTALPLQNPQQFGKTPFAAPQSIHS
jgi:type II secretory pathway predicted ATPase ExeA